MKTGTSSMTLTKSSSVSPSGQSTKLPSHTCTTTCLTMFTSPGMVDEMYLYAILIYYWNVIIRNPRYKRGTTISVLVASPWRIMTFLLQVSHTKCGVYQDRRSRSSCILFWPIDQPHFTQTFCEGRWLYGAAYCSFFYFFFKSWENIFPCEI